VRGNGIEAPLDRRDDPQGALRSHEQVDFVARGRERIEGIARGVLARLGEGGSDQTPSVGNGTSTVRLKIRLRSLTTLCTIWLAALYRRPATGNRTRVRFQVLSRRRPTVRCTIHPTVTTTRPRSTNPSPGTRNPRAAWRGRPRMASTVRKIQRSTYTVTPTGAITMRPTKK